MKLERQSVSWTFRLLQPGTRRPNGLPVAWLHAAFLLTGIGTTLFGCVLPSISSIWGLNDARAGLLFAAQFLGSALGALLVGRDFYRSVVRGYLLLIVGSGGISFFAGAMQAPLFFAFGLGLGLTMTSTSMLIAGAYPLRRGSALSILNVAWGIGAAISPVITAFWVKRCGPAYLFSALAVGVAIIFVFVVRKQATFVPASGNEQNAEAGFRMSLVSILAVMAFLYVGTEASVSGWMMSYVHRMTNAGGAWAAIATSCFWIALLGGRTLLPVALRWITEAQVLSVSIFGSLIGVSEILFGRGPLAVVAGAAFTGLTLAPIFPLCLSRVLALMRDSPNSKWIFAISGLGGAFLPWLTGEVSAYSRSLRSGLFTAAIALVAMAVLDLVSRKWVSS